MKIEEFEEFVVSCRTKLKNMKKNKEEEIKVEHLFSLIDLFASNENICQEMQKFIMKEKEVEEEMNQ